MKSKFPDTVTEVPVRNINAKGGLLWKLLIAP